MMEFEVTNAWPPLYPCPVCGHIVFPSVPGSFIPCPICRWNDDPIQLRWPDYQGGANPESLIMAQESYAAIGAATLRDLPRSRRPTPHDRREPGWRPVEPSIDHFETWDPTRPPEWPDDMTSLYYWRPTFWRRAAGA
jgi:hypothetical protein